MADTRRRTAEPARRAFARAGRTRAASGRTTLHVTQAGFRIAPAVPEVGEHGKPGSQDQNAPADPYPVHQRIEVGLERSAPLLRIKPRQNEVQIVAQRVADVDLGRGVLPRLVEVLARDEGAGGAIAVEDRQPGSHELAVRVV